MISTPQFTLKALLIQKLSPNYGVSQIFGPRAKPSVTFFSTIEMGHDAQVVSGASRSMMGRAQLIERVVHGEDIVWGAGVSRPCADMQRSISDDSLLTL